MLNKAEIQLGLLILKSMKQLLSSMYKMLSRSLPFSLLLLIAVGSVLSMAQAEQDEAALMNTEVEQPAANQPVAQRPASLVEFGNAVKAYREGDYIQARKILYPLHKQHPENSRMTYYLAITEAQLGRFQQAKKLYEEILSLDPNSEAAQLATEGLKFLPSETSMDLPPRFQENTQRSGSASNPPSSTNQPAIGQGGNGMPMPSPQEWMALQMMMGQNGMSSTGGMNAMPWMSQGANPMGGNPYGMGALDPNAMSSMMMNQMLQNFTLSGDKDDDR